MHTRAASSSSSSTPSGWNSSGRLCPHTELCLCCYAGGELLLFRDLLAAVPSSSSSNPSGLKFAGQHRHAGGKLLLWDSDDISQNIYSSHHHILCSGCRDMSCKDGEIVSRTRCISFLLAILHLLLSLAFHCILPLIAAWPANENVVFPK